MGFMPCFAHWVRFAWISWGEQVFTPVFFRYAEGNFNSASV